MAVVNAYVNTSKHINAREASGSVLYSSIVTFEVAAADDDTSKYRIAKLPSSVIVKNIEIRNDAVTAGTDYDVGIYQTSENGSAVVDADFFADALDLSSAHICGSELSGIKDLPVEDSSEALYEMLGVSLGDEPEYYDLVLTANTVGTAAGTVAVLIEYIM